MELKKSELTCLEKYVNVFTEVYTIKLKELNKFEIIRTIPCVVNELEKFIMK
jgi:hypothetical protein